MLLLLGLNARADGRSPTSTVETTVLVELSITETSFELVLAT